MTWLFADADPQSLAEGDHGCPCLVGRPPATAFHPGPVYIHVMCQVSSNLLSLSCGSTDAHEVLVTQDHHHLIVHFPQPCCTTSPSQWWCGAVVLKTFAFAEVTVGG